jgi:hypothetical protein
VAFTQARAQQSLPAAAPTTATAAGVTLRSVSIEFPDRGQMFPGKDADAINSNCLACHSVGMVLQQPTLSPATWQAEVEKMGSQYKAPVDPSDVPAIVAYLTAHKARNSESSQVGVSVRSAQPPWSACRDLGHRRHGELPGRPADEQIATDALVTTRGRSPAPGALRRLKWHARLRVRASI